MAQFIPCTTNGERTLVNVDHIAFVTGSVVRLSNGHSMTVTLEEATRISQALIDQSAESKRRPKT